MDTQLPSTLILEHFTLFCTFGLLALVINWVASIAHYFHRPCWRYLGVKVSGKNVGAFFAIFILVFFAMASCAAIVLRSYQATVNISLWMAIVQIASFALLIFLFWIYSITQGSSLIKEIWKQHDFPCKKNYWIDIALGIVTWPIAIAVVIAVDQIFELMVLYFFNFQGSEQVAVTFLKEAMENPVALVIALFSIVVCAPIIEEFLFRGVLFSWLRTRFGLQTSICMSSAAFALFHYSSIHSYGNIPLFASLFSFACYLAFLYERQRSLLSPIILHVTFNLISVIRILSMT